LLELDIVPEKYRQVQRHRLFQQKPVLFLEPLIRFQWLARRMPSLATGALFADATIRGIGVSGTATLPVLEWGNSSMFTA